MRVGTSAARQRLLSFAFGTSGLALAMAMTTAAAAQCVPNPTIADSVTQCTGTDTGGVLVATPNSTVVVAADATVTATSASAVTIDVPVAAYGSNYETVSVSGRVQGIGTAGITLNNGSIATSGYYYGPTTSLTLNVAAGGVVGGTTALTLGQSDGNTTGMAIATIDNAGTLTGTRGIALLATDASLGGFTSITNRSGGTIGAISGAVGILANAGTIDGGANSAIDAGTSYNPYLAVGSWTNTGIITSAATTATLRNVSAPLVNSGVISNTGGGIALQGTNLTVTNQAGGRISAPGGTAIAAGGALTLVNAGTIDGDVTVSPSADSYYAASSTIDSTAGTINGNVTLGSGNDVLVARYVGTPTLATGITGTIDGGGGIDSVRIASARDTVIDTAVTLPTGFQQLQLAPAIGTTVTLADGFVAPGTITLVGADSSGGGAVVNDAALTFSGQAFASQVYNAPASFTNAGSISVTGGTIGTPALDLSGIATFTNTGSIDVVGTGINTSVNGTTANSGTITATGTALTAFDNVVTNSGTIQSTAGIGLAVSGNTGTPAYNSGLIEGATVGVSTSIDLTNSGTILATNADGTAVALDAYGSLINQAGGIVGNGGLAVTASIFNSTVANAGTINGDVVLSNVYSGAGQRYFALTGGVLNGNLSLGDGDLLVTDLVNTGPGAFAGITGTVSADAGALLRYQVSSDASATLGPVGPFRFASYQLADNATLDLTAPAEITQTLQLAGTGTVNLDASISTSSAPAILSTSTILAPGQTGAATQLNIVSAGTITVTRAADTYPIGAVYLGSNDSFTNNGTIRVIDAQSYSPTAAVFGGAAVTNNGAIQLDGGIGVSESASLVNTGTIAQVSGGAIAQGVLDVPTLDNSGTISVEGDAVARSTYFYGPMSIVNRATGLIATTGSQSAAIDSGALSLDNAGMISASPGSAAILAAGYSANSIRNSGTIDGDILLGSGGNIVENSGTIDGQLTFGAGDDQLTLLPGSKITGTVDGGDGNDQVTLAGSGSGSFAGAVNFERLDVASGNWTLTGASGFVDGTFIEHGASLAGSAGLLGAAIVDNGTLVVDQPTDATFTGSLSGDGLFQKAGVGTLTIGSQDFTGITDVSAGTLLVAGTLPSTVKVEKGATLAGTGQIASATILTGGAIAPGVGTLSVVGSLAQQADSTYVATILPGAISSRIAVTGTASIASGAAISVIRGAGDYQVGTRYLLLTAAGGITGNYMIDQATAADTELRLVVAGDDLYADLVRSGASLVALARTRNEASVAAAFGTLGAQNAVYAALTLDPSDTDVRAGLDRLAGEIHASARTAMVHDAMLVEGSVLDRIQPGMAQPAGLWGQFLGGHGEDDGRGGVSNTQRNSYGGIAGYDIAVGDTLRVGIAAGYTHTKLTLDSLDSSAEIGTGHVLGYAAGSIDALHADIGLGYAWSRLHTRRNLDVAGFTDSDRGRYDGNLFHGFGELGYALPLGGGAVEPYVGGTVLRVHSSRFAEQGGAAALDGVAHDDWVEFSDVGLKVTTPIVANLSASARVAWQHAYGAVQPDAVLSFGAGTAAYAIRGASLSRDAVTPSAEIGWQAAPKTRVSVGYSGLIGAAGANNSGRLTLAIGF